MKTKLGIFGFFIGFLGIISVIQYHLSDYRKTTCQVVDYQERDQGIRAIVILDKNHTGHTNYQCAKGKPECYLDFMDKRPINSTYNCWYDSYENEPYIVYNNEPVKWILGLAGIFGVSSVVILTVAVVSDFDRKRVATFLRLKETIMLLCMLFALCVVFLFIFGMEVGREYNTTYIGTQCEITEYYEYQDSNKIMTWARVEILNDLGNLLGVTENKCNQNIHHYNDQKYQDCLGELKTKRPENTVHDCWYNPKSEVATSYTVYWQKPEVTYYEPTMIAVGVFTALLLLFMISTNYLANYIDPDPENQNLLYQGTSYSRYNDIENNFHVDTTLSNYSSTNSDYNVPTTQSSNKDINDGPNLYPSIDYSIPIAPPPNDTTLSNSQDTSTQDNDQYLCDICRKRYRDLVFVPCSHQYSCSICAKNLKTCPVCRADITSTVKLILS
jgi:hypothetical protein